jgi:hypothetical protein
MNDYQTKTRAILDELHTASHDVQTMQDLEKLVIDFERRLAKTAFEELAQELAARTFPPQTKLSNLPNSPRTTREHQR